MSAFAEKLTKATNEDKQVNGIYVKELQAKIGEGKLGGGR